MLSDNFEMYHEHLKKKSRLGDIYRKFFLYPTLARYTRGRTLDVGCGTGEFCLYRKGTDGADINPLNVKLLKDHGVTSFLLENDKIPCPDASYDTVLMDNVLEHIQDPNPLMTEVNRVLRPEGRLVIGVPGVKGFYTEEDHKVFYNENDLIQFTSGHHFVLVTRFYMPIRSKFLDRHMKQYCLYGVFEKS